VLSGAALPGGLVMPAKGSSTEEILEDYPLLEPKDIQADLLCAQRSESETE
jgi:uncharacterized protein (DUF433 family)